MISIQYTAMRVGYILPILIIASIIFISLSVTVATVDRSFSKLKLIKNYLRNIIGQDRLPSVVILNIERDVANKLDLERVISKFANFKIRKKKTLMVFYFKLHI